MSMTSRDIMRLTGLTYRQIENWTKQGYLCPENAPGIGRRGVHRIFSRDQLRIAQRMVALGGCGFTPAAAHLLATGDADSWMKLDLAVSSVRASLSS